MKWQLRRQGKAHVAEQNTAKQYFAQESCISCYRVISEAKIHLVLHMLLVSHSFTPLLCCFYLLPVAIQLCFLHQQKVFSSREIVLDKIAKITLCVKDLLCGCRSISLQYFPCFASTPPQQHTRMHLRTLRLISGPVQFSQLKGLFLIHSTGPHEGTRIVISDEQGSFQAGKRGSHFKLPFICMQLEADCNQTERSLEL